MKVHFWGVRGSIPTPSKDTAIYGGNTSCVSVELDNGKIIIFDAGTGIREYGDLLMARGGPITAAIFISHTHWDHIQGFPFFVPSYMKGNSLNIHGPASAVHKMGIREIMEMQTRYEVFPVRIAELGSNLNYLDIADDSFSVDGLDLTVCRLNHPVPCFAYKIRENDKTYVYGGDHEPYQNIYRIDPQAAAEMDEDFLAELDQNVAQQNTQIAEFLRGADLVSWDSMYTREEYEEKKGWGHSWYECNLELAATAEVKQMIFTHHAPSATDEILASREEIHTAAAAAKGLNLAFAREGMEIEL
ncbi:MAG: MBL fold metallo-hydrolase [Planctomycetes bacterium]|nr:MBL fold metallo-hydrolase [Planctomycetota bacterium]